VWHASLIWHASFICVTLHSCVWQVRHDSILCVTRLIHETWLNYMCDTKWDMTQSYVRKEVRHDSIICVTQSETWLNYMCDTKWDMEWLYVWHKVRHDSISCVTQSETWLTHMCHTHHSYVWHPSPTRGMSPIHMGWLRWVGSLKLQVSFAQEPYKRKLYSAKETYNFKEPTNRSHPICVTSLTNTRHVTHSYVWHASSIHVWHALLIWHASFIHASFLHASFVTASLIHMCDMPH